MDSNNPKPSQSLYAKQAKLLGVTISEEYQGSQEELQREAESMATVRLPELVLPTRRSNRHYITGALALAASILIGVWNSQQTQPTSKPGEDFQMKGRSHLSIHVQREAQIFPEYEGDLAEGDRFRLALRSSTTGLAFILYFDQKNEPLTSVEESLKAAINITSSSETEFPGSAVVTGKSIGEKVAVVICPETDFAKIKSANLKNLTADITDAIETGRRSLNQSQCEIISRILRPISVPKK